MIKKTLEKMFNYCGLESTRYVTFFTLLLYFSLVFSLAAWFFSSSSLFLSLVFLVPLIVYLSMLAILYVISVARARKMEKVLPEFLLNLASNLESGIPMSNAILLSAKPCYGALSKEFIYLSKESKTSESFYRALKELKKKFRSKKFADVIDLLSESWSKGASVSKLLFNMANDLRKFDLLEREKNAEISAQVSFVLITILFAVPFLFGGSYTFIIGTAALKGQSIDATFLSFFTVAIIILNSFFASMIINLIKGGEKLEGALKYFPFIAVASLLVFVFVLKFFTLVLTP